MPRDHLLLYVNGKRHALRGPDVFTSLSTWLRSQQGLTGTKVVCAEGDCGSCAVLLGRAGEAGLRYRVVTSCIQYLFQLDGCHVVTVEGLSDGGELNAVQRAMVRCQGTQCGFCTPGFVVSMCGLVENRQPMTEGNLRRGLSGNLCRCTGYEPILRAGMEVDAGQMRSLAERYPDARLAEELRQAERESVRVELGEQLLFKPSSVAEAAAFRGAYPQCVIVAGGTDIGVQLNKGLRQVKTVMSIAHLHEIGQLRREGDRLVVGAGVSIDELEMAARESLPEYGELLEHFGSLPIKNAGTLGGNIANGSPIGDSMPALFVLHAEVELASPTARRRVNINQFYTGYKRNVMAADEIISGVVLPLPSDGDVLKLYKISKRKDLDISTFTAAVWMRRTGEMIGDIRIAYGGVGPTILRLPGTEQHLRGQVMGEELFDAAADIAAAEVAPISDVRGSAGYRQQLAGNVLRKFYFDVTGQCQSELAPVGSNGNGHAKRMSGLNGDRL